MRRLINILPVLGFILSGCGGGQTAQEERHFTLSNDSIYIRSKELIEDKIKIASGGTESVSREVVTAGTVQAIPTQFAYIAPPFSGRITRSCVKMGQRVNTGTPLFEMISPDFTELQKEYFQAQSELEMARKDLERKQELVSQRLCPERDFEEALNTYKLAEKDFENAGSALRVYHVNPDDMVLGQPLVVRSPISGNVIENNIVTGLYLSEDADPIALVADLSKVWIAAQVKEKDIRFIREGDKLKISVTALPGEEIEGTVYHVDEIVDEDTRSINVLSICDNRDERLKLGMYATVNFFGDEQRFTVVSERAVLQNENSSYVISKVDDQTLVKMPVEVEFTKNGKAYISAGLMPQDRIVCEGGYYFQ